MQSTSDPYDTPKESESPRFKAIMQATSAPRKKGPVDIKSYSHELNSKGVRPYPNFWKPRGVYNLKVIFFPKPLWVFVCYSISMNSNGFSFLNFSC
jgi:hypothetical protein